MLMLWWPSAVLRQQSSIVMKNSPTGCMTQQQAFRLSNSYLPDQYTHIWHTINLTYWMVGTMLKSFQGKDMSISFSMTIFLSITVLTTSRHTHTQAHTCTVHYLPVEDEKFNGVSLLQSFLLKLNIKIKLAFVSKSVSVGGNESSDDCRDVSNWWISSSSIP